MTKNIRVAIIASSVVLAFSMPVLWIVREQRAAEREYVSYERLSKLGATGDDWVSFRELITGKPPIVQINIPTHIPPKITFGELPNLRNLEHLTLAYPSLTADQIQAIGKLRLKSLQFQGNFPRDTDVPDFALLRGLRFLYIPSTNLSMNAQLRLQSLLPSSRVQFD